MRPLVPFKPSYPFSARTHPLYVWCRGACILWAHSTCDGCKLENLRTRSVVEQPFVIWSINNRNTDSKCGLDVFNKCVLCDFDLLHWPLSNRNLTSNPPKWTLNFGFLTKLYSFLSPNACSVSHPSAQVIIRLYCHIYLTKIFVV